MHDGSHESFVWWHPECTATCFIIVTIEIHGLIFDVFACDVKKIIWIKLKTLINYSSAVLTA